MTAVAEPADIRESADDILARPEYQPEPPSLLDRAWTWINEQFAELLGSLFGTGGSYLVGWILLAVLAGLLGWFLVRVMPRNRLGRNVAEPVVETDVRATASRDDWLAQAGAAEAAGDWREAVRARYRAMIAGLIDRQEVADFDGATSGEYRASFEPGPPRSDSLDQATETFEQIWYGGSPAQADDSSRLEELASRTLGGN